MTQLARLVMTEITSLERQDVETTALTVRPPVKPEDLTELLIAQQDKIGEQRMTIYVLGGLLFLLILVARR